MLSDSSSSELNCSPVIQRKLKRYKVSTDDSSEDDVQVRRPLRGIRSRVPSSSSSSSSSSFSDRPRKRRRAIVESESSSDSYESDGPTLPFRKDGRTGIQSDSDGYSSEIQAALGTSSIKDAKNDGSSSDSEGDHCIICFKTLHHPVAQPSSCSHVFHEQCLSTWSKTSNTCPIDRVKYNCINTVNSDGKVLSKRNVTTPTPGNHSDFEPDNPTFCEVCHFHDREEVMLLCDRCDAGYHIDCLDPPMPRVPIGQWFCHACELTNIEDNEVLELLADNVLMDSRLRNRPERPTRMNPRLGLTRAVRAALNLANNASSQQVTSHISEEPSTSTGRRATSVKKPRKSRKNSRRKRSTNTTKYKVELVTTEDGTPVEVKLAIQSRGGHRKKKKTSSKRSHRSSGGRCKDEGGAGPSQSHHRSTYQPSSLDLFGSRPTLDYFSGCEGGDEEEFGGGRGGEVGLLRAGQSAFAGRSGLISRKGIAQVLASSSSSPRPRINIEAPVSSVNVLDDILRDQELWHHPGPANISSSSNGAVRVTLPKDSSGCPTRKSAIHGGRNENRGGGRYGGGQYNGGRYGGGRPQSRSGVSGRNVSGGQSNVSTSSTSGAGPSGSSSGSFRQSQPNFSAIQPLPTPPVPPLAPPPEPPLRLVEDDDLDIYGDIEPPPAMAKLVPPPEPPAMLLALDNQAADEGASSPDEALVIDDQRDTYDPDQPNSPSSGNRTDEEDSSEKTPVELPDIPLPTQGIRLEDIRLPSPSKHDDDSDSEVPITEHYSKASLKIARNSSDSSEEDGQYIDDIIERFKKAPPLNKEDASDSEKKLNEHVEDDQSPVKEKLRKFEKERSTKETSEESIRDKEAEEPSSSGADKDEQVSDKIDKCGQDLRESEHALCSEDSTPLRDEKELSEDERADDSLEQPEDSNFKGSETERPSTPPQIEDISLNVDNQINKDNDGEENKYNTEDKEKKGEKDHTASDKESSPEQRGEDEELKECDVEDHEKLCELDSSTECCDVSSDVSKSLDKSDENKLLAEGDPFDSPTPSPKPQRKRKSAAKSSENENFETDNRVDSSEKTNKDNVEVEDHQEIIPEEQSLSIKDGNEGYLSAEDKKSIEDDEIGLHNGHKSRSLSPANSLSSGEVQSDASDSLDISDCSSLPSPKRRSRKRKFRKNDYDDDNEYDGALNDSLNSGLAEGDKDGLVEITDDEMSSYEKNWEIEENEKHLKQSGLEGLETEAISECEDALCEDSAPASQVKSSTETYLSKEEGEIITDDRNEFIPWKRVTKSTKDRSYREKDKTKDKDKDKTPEKKKKDKKQKEKRKDLERYDIRKVIVGRRRKDEFGRDIVSSQSRSASRESGVIRSEVRRVRDWSKTRKRSRARSLSRSRNRDKSTSRGNGKRRRSRGRSLDRNRTKYTRDKDRKRSRGRSKTRKDQSRDRKKSQNTKSTDKKRGVDKSSERRDRSGGKDKSRDDRDKKAVSSSSCSTCSCSSCERERLATNKLAVSVPNVQNPPTKKNKDKKKDKSRKTAKKDNKRRRTESPLPSKEVFTSGDNILVSVNFKSSSKTTGDPTRRGGSRRVWEEENRKKKDKENQPVRSVVPILAATQEKDKRRQRRRMASNAKPVAIIDLDPSPFREEAVSPAEIIILTDESDNEAGGKQGDAIHQSSSTGPKTPPEPPVKFTISSKPPLRSLTNPLEEADEEGDRGDDDGGEPIVVMHKGPNTPPEPPETYDPFEPTKSRSPSPRRENIRGPSSADTQIVNNSEVLSDGKQQPSPQPKTQEVANAEKPNFVMEADLEFSLGGDSPYSPGSSEADDLFDPPPVTPTRSKPLRPLGALPLPATPVAANKPKITPSPTKRRQPANRLTPVMRKAAASKKEIGIRLDENQLKILDELPSSAVEMQVKDKFLKKLNRQERVVEEVKFVLKPHYNKKHVTKEEYKDILRKAVPKICHSKSGEINPFKIQKLIEAYVKKYRHKRKKTGPALPKTKTAKVLPPILKSMFGNLGMRSQDTLNNRSTSNKTM